jgi:antitoxin component of MazEF toxin-antitoxin module
MKGYYRYYMPNQKLKVARIGNSRGVRLPAETLERYRIGDSVIMEERAEGILLRPSGSATPKLSWEETAKAMSQADEDWAEWQATSADGVAALSWDEVPVRRVAEPAGGYPSPRSKPRGKK